MARTKKIGLKSNHGSTQPAASRQPSKFSGCASHTSVMTLSVVIESISNITKTSARRSSEVVKQTKAVIAQPIMDIAGKSSTHLWIELRLTLSIAFEPTNTSNERPSTGQKIRLLDLPIEVRVMIYTHVLALADNACEVKHYTRLSKCQRRRNAYKVSNIEHYHFAITSVNQQISNEIKAHVPAQSLRFASTSALDDFLLCGADEVRLIMLNLNVLYKAKAVEVMIKKRPVPRPIREHCAWLYETLAYLLPEPLTIELVSEESSDERFKLVFEGVGGNSDSRMEDLEGKLFGSESC